MTALKQYELLEAEGSYFDGKSAQPREVVVKFGDASLMILDLQDMPITHWPLATLRSLGAAGPGLSLIPDYGADERLTINDSQMIEAISAVCPKLNKTEPVSGRRWTRVAGWAALALGSVYLIIFHLLPALSDQLAELIPPEAEAAMGEEMVDQFASILTTSKTPRFCSTPDGTRALQRMLARAEGVSNPHLPLRVQVLDHKMVNAFALPGGQIVLFRGLIDKADSPEEVAGVLAHEIGHVVNRDPTRIALRSAGSAGLLGLLLGDFTGATVTVALSEALLRSGYQREAEAAADDFANAALSAQGLPTKPFAGFFLKLKEISGDQPEFLSHLASHPDLSGRANKAEAADKIGDQPFTPALSDQDWVALQQICG